jgi:hypothetical protein
MAVKRITPTTAKDNGIPMKTSGSRDVIEYQTRWDSLVTYCNHWWHKPDMEGLRIALSAYVAHHYIEDDPVWLFLIGVPGSGKTSIGIRSLSFMPSTHSESKVGSNTFFSGFGDDNGLLQMLTKKHGGNGVLLFSDFSVFLSLRQETRDELISEMRAIYDGFHCRHLGNKGIVSWKGKVTIMAACTPAIEEYWALTRGLGERFMYLRWGGSKMPNLNSVSESAVKQIGHEEEIKAGLAKRVLAAIDPTNLQTVDKATEWESTGLVDLASLVARLRVTIKRETVGSKRHISSIDQPELPTRILKSLAQIARGSATIARRNEVAEEDIRLARRVALDTLPPYRAAIIRALVKDPSYELRATRLTEVVKIPKMSFNRVIEDLTSIGAVETYLVDGEDKIISLTPEFKTFALKADL